MDGSKAKPSHGLDQRPTIDTVARMAGVSRQTVSNALRSPSLLAPQTLRRVLAAVDALGYRPHSGARALRRQTATGIACRIPDGEDGINAALYTRYLRGLSAALAPAGFGLRLVNAAWGQHEVDTYLDLHARAEVAAVVLMDPQSRDDRVAALRVAGVPTVLYGRPWDGSPVPWVDVDGAAGVGDAVRWCAQRGHRRIGFLGWDETEGVSRDRERGWRAALEALDLPWRGLSEHGLPDSVSTGSRLASALLDSREPPTALVCATDLLALGALNTVRDRGLRPGTDVAVIGFDDTPTAAVADLSSVSQPVIDVAYASADLVRAELARVAPTHSGRLVPAKLVRRAT